jgi:hypothetical protein
MQTNRPPLGDDVNLLAFLVDVIEANEAFRDHVLQRLLDRGAVFISLSHHAGHQAHLGDDVNLQAILVDVIEANEVFRGHVLQFLLDQGATLISLSRHRG